MSAPVNTTGLLDDDEEGISKSQIGSIARERENRFQVDGRGRGILVSVDEEWLETLR